MDAGDVCIRVVHVVEKRLDAHGITGVELLVEPLRAGDARQRSIEGEAQQLDALGRVRVGRLEVHLDVFFELARHLRIRV